MLFSPPKLTFLQEHPICVPRKLGTRGTRTDEKPALSRELLPGPGISQVWRGAMPRPANGKKDWLAGAGNFVAGEISFHGIQMRHRRPAECRQVDAPQRADRNGGGAGGELSVLHHRTECR